jgi:hypothetical protein
MFCNLGDNAKRFKGGRFGSWAKARWVDCDLFSPDLKVRAISRREPVGVLTPERSFYFLSFHRIIIVSTFHNKLPSFIVQLPHAFTHIVFE